MSSQDLRGLLGQLHARLAHAKSLDAESRKLLLTVAADIEKVLAGNDGAAARIARGAIRGRSSRARRCAATDRGHARQSRDLTPTFSQIPLERPVARAETRAI
jgi:hypothetical protein